MYLDGRESVPTQPIGDYVADAVLGEGGTAIVYRAHLRHGGADKTEGRRPPVVALKVLKPAAATQPQVLASFLFEMRVVARLNHPGILRVYASGVEGDAIYAVMELVDGVSFDQYLLAKKRLPERLAVDLTCHLAEALDYLHRHGYVHRDVKPANLILTNEGRIVLFDFGTVIRIDDGAAYESGLYGTPAFLAPEQIAEGRHIDGRADLYALGMVLYLMVTGRKPFYGGRDEVLDFHLNTQPPPPSDFARTSPELERIILKAIDKDPDARFQTGAELAQALREITLLPPQEPGFVARLLARLRSGT